MHEPLLIALVFPFLRVKPWQLRSTPKMYSMGGELRKCSKRRRWTHGIFCANFGEHVTGSHPCRRMWCGRCYSLESTNDFHVADPENLYAVSMRKREMRIDCSLDGEPRRVIKGDTVKLAMVTTCWYLSSATIACLPS